MFIYFPPQKSSKSPLYFDRHAVIAFLNPAFYQYFLKVVDFKLLKFVLAAAHFILMFVFLSNFILNLHPQPELLAPLFSFDCFFNAPLVHFHLFVAATEWVILVHVTAQILSKFRTFGVNVLQSGVEGFVDLSLRLKIPNLLWASICLPFPILSNERFWLIILRFWYK